MSDDPQPLAPIETHHVEVYGHSVPSARVVDPETAGERVYVAARYICEAVGLDWPRQRRTMRQDPILSDVLTGVSLEAPPTPGKRRGGAQPMLCLPLEFLHGWLFRINPNRVKPEARDDLVHFQRDCYRILYDVYYGRALATRTEATSPLAQVRDMGLAIARLAQEQIEHEIRLTTVEGRIDRASLVFKGWDRRLTTVENRVFSGQPVSEEQSAEIKEAVKALAMLLEEQDGKSYFQAVYGEMYRRFGVSSYKNIKASDYAQVMQFLDGWRERELGEEG